MPTIGLTQGQRARVDWCDWKRLAEFKWHAMWNPKTRSYYAGRKEPGGPHRQCTVRMHRELLGLVRGDRRQVDHKNHDTLDNRRLNIHVVTNRGNQENSRAQSRHGVGVHHFPKRISKPFEAHTQIKGRQIHLGYFATAEEARAARRHFVDQLPETDQ